METTSMRVNDIYRYKDAQHPYLDFLFKFLGMGTGIYDGWYHYIRQDNGEEAYMKFAPEYIYRADEEPKDAAPSVIDPQKNHSFQPAPIQTDEETEEQVGDILSQLHSLASNKANKKQSNKASNKASKKQSNVSSVEQAAAQVINSQQKEKDKKRSNTQTAIKFFSIFAAAALVCAICVFGIGIIAAIAFAGAGGMLAKG